MNATNGGSAGAHPVSSFGLTDLQQSYWVGQMGHLDLSCSAHRYFEIDAVGLDLERLEQAFQRVIEAHPLLRAEVLPEGLWQVLPEVPRFAIECVDLRGREAASVGAALGATRAAMSRRGPAPDTWPLVQVRAHLLEEGRVRLHVTASLMVLDSASWRVVCAQLESLYRNPDVTLQSGVAYHDYVAALEKVAASDAYRRSAEAWRGRLAELPGAPELPLQQSPAAVGDVEGMHLEFRLEREVWGAFTALSRGAGLTLQAALTTAYSDVIARWSKSPRFTLTTLLENRAPDILPGLDGLVGNCSATLLVEVDASGRSFGERTRALMGSYLRSVRHRHINGVWLARELNRATERGMAPAFPVVFNCVLPRTPTSRTLGWLGETVYDVLRTPQVWLDCQAYESQGELYVKLDAPQGLFPDGMLSDMFDALRASLVRLAQSGEAWREASAPPLPGPHLALRAAVNATEQPVSEQTLHGLFESQAARCPDALAVVDGDGCRLSYGELLRRVGVLRARLTELGLRPGTLAAVVMEKGWEQVAATLAIMMNGAAYLPINPSHTPRERLWHVLADADANIVLTQSRLASSLAWPAETSLVCVDTLDYAASPEERSPSTRDPDQLAYVIYTSGSSGTPKGVVIAHRGAVNTVLDINRRFSVTDADRVFAISSLSFDLSVYDLFGTLAAGGTIVLPRQHDTHDPEAWAAQMCAAGVTVWNSAPQLLDLLVESTNEQPQRLPRGLRLAMLSGDWIPVSLPDRLRSLAPAAEVVGLGGATEASIWSIFYKIGEVNPHWTSIPYGKPLANQWFDVLDHHLRPSPVGVPGELYIGGIGLAQGYWRDEAKTTARFIVHPETGQRLYRTGDVGRYLPDGNIEFMGRCDAQVKVSGHRVELGEIEAALCALAGVRQGHVTVRYRSAGQGASRGPASVVAYVVAEAGQRLEPESLRERLRARLPEYMVPAHFVLLDALPLSPNGKLDPRRLPAPQHRSEATSPTGEAADAPTDEVEARLVSVWREVLKLERVSTRADFFELGGDSLTAARMLGRLRGAFGRALPASTLFRHRTVAQLAVALRSVQEEQSESLVRLTEGEPEQALFAVHAVGGSALSYMDLTRLIDVGIPFFALQSPTLTSKGGSFARLEDLAGHYVASLRAVQDRGPYRLCGWSMGGLVAFEMARQLEASGERVSFLGLIDSFAPRAEPRDDVPEDATLLAWWVADLAGALGQGTAELAARLKAEAHQGRAALLKAVVGMGVLPPAIDQAQVEVFFEAFRNNVLLARQYMPRGRVPAAVILRATEGPTAEFAQHPALRDPALSDPLMGWGAFVAHPRIRYVPGNHYTIVRAPHARMLALHLNDVLRTGED
jgi:pyochelin synthetase